MAGRRQYLGRGIPRARHHRAPHPIETPALFGQGDPIETLFQGLLTSIITGVALVLALSQLVLSQELGPVGNQRERMEGAISFRKNVEDVIEDIDDETLSDQVAAFTGNVNGNADAVENGLKDAQFGEFDVVASALNYHYSWESYAARRMRAENEDVLTEDAHVAVAELIDALDRFGTAR